MEILQILSKKRNSEVKLIRMNDHEYVSKSYFKYSKSAFTELNILSSCNHENIIKAIKIETSKDSQTFNIFMPKLEHNFLDMIDNNSLSMDKRIYFLLQIAHGVRYLHHNHIVHMDLKSENILINNDICHIIDFDSSEYIFDKISYTDRTICTTTHRPPEGFLLDNQEYFLPINYSFDIWSFGIIILETLTGVPLYRLDIAPKFNNKYINMDDYDHLMYKFIMSSVFRDYVNNTLPEELRLCLNIEPEGRPDIDNVIESLKKIYVKLTGSYSEELFDKSLKLRTDNNFKQLDLKFLDEFFMKKLNEKCPELIKKYQKEIISSIINLSKKISLIPRYENSVIDTAISICSYFVNNREHLNDVIIDDIISVTNGIIFQY